MEHVYGVRNKYLIILRKFDNYLYSLIKDVSKYIRSKQINNKNYIICYPPFDDSDKLYSVLNKLAWAFPSNSNIIIKCIVNKDIKVDLNKVKLRYQNNYLDNSKHIEVIHNWDKKDNLLNDARIIVLHDKKYRYNYSILKFLYKCELVDSEYYSIEEGNFLKFGYYNNISNKQKELYRRLSVDNFTNLINSNKHKLSSYIFVTGPSFNSYKKFNYDKSSLKIICNTIVKDDEFMEYIGGPDVITFADPVFHFSSNNYAAEFRNLVLKVIRKYNCYVIVPASTVPLLVLNYPELKNYIIGMRRSKKINFPNIQDLSVRPSGSVITFLMLPLATSLTDKIYVLGADGRSPKENYFWKHNEKVQLNDLMDSVFMTHPSFFRDRIYSNHYDEHCKYLEKIILEGETIGKQYISLTNSYIPAFAKRHTVINTII